MYIGKACSGAVDPEEVHLGAKPQHEIVVRERRHLCELHLPRGEVDPRDLVLMDGGVWLLVEQPSQRMPDGRRLEQVGGDLVEQRLERVVVVLVVENDVGLGVLELPRGAEARETAAKYQDPRPQSLVFAGLTRHLHLSVDA